VSQVKVSVEKLPEKVPDAGIAKVPAVIDKPVEE
jgi:hypothetical protein